MYDFPRNLYQLTPMEARVPRIVATIPDVMATTRLFSRACHNGFDENTSFSYHTKEKPVQVVSFALLNEKTTITKSGRKRKSKETTSTVFEKLKGTARFFQPRFACLAFSVDGTFLNTLLYKANAGFFILFLQVLRLRWRQQWKLSCLPSLISC